MWVNMGLMHREGEVKGASGAMTREISNEVRGYLVLCRLDTNIRLVTSNVESNLLSVR